MRRADAGGQTVGARIARRPTPCTVWVSPLATLSTSVSATEPAPTPVSTLKLDDVAPARVVVGAAGFLHVRRVVVGDRIVVLAVDGDGDLRGRGAASAVGDRVAERVGQRLRERAQALHRRVGVVDRVGVAAVGLRP